MRFFYKKITDVKFRGQEKYPELEKKIAFIVKYQESKDFSIFAKVKDSGVIFKITSTGEYLEDEMYIFIPNDFILFVIME